MASYIVYDNATGEVLRTGNAPPDQIAAQAGAGETAVSGITANDETQRWDLASASLVARTPYPGAVSITLNANGVDTADFTGLPNPTYITVSGPASAYLTETSGSLSLTFDTPGTYKISISAFPYANKEIEVVAI